VTFVQIDKDVVINLGYLVVARLKLHEGKGEQSRVEYRLSTGETITVSYNTPKEALVAWRLLGIAAKLHQVVEDDAVGNER